MTSVLLFSVNFANRKNPAKPNYHMSIKKSQAILKCFIDLKNSVWFTLGSEDERENIGTATGNPDTLQSTLSKTDTFGTGTKCPSYRESNKGSKERQGPTLSVRFGGVRLKEVSVKRQSTVLANRKNRCIYPVLAKKIIRCIYLPLFLCL